MNFGRFFKLNQYMSDMVAGVTIYDYTELPAYEGLASGNPSSPKYPISLTITESAVRFKMHYCVYRCSNPNDNSDPLYGFSIDDIKRQLYKDYPSDNYEKEELNIVHIEEVILELPFAGIRANDLTDIIKKSYIANFPHIHEGEESDNNVFTGNRFLNKKINDELKPDNHNINTDPVSYSTLWLMDLYDTDGKLDLKGDSGLVDKFLRKLLLDFMFDLKHSKVFQTCTEYDRMYSGLMADYYFSALMHKCEYYYYRDLTTQAINSFEKKKKENELQKNDERKIVLLYAKELFDAEEKWANNIRNPLSEELFEHNFPFSGIDQKRGRWLSEAHSLICERMTATCWDSWFANPEEEMRRIYFPFKTYHNHKDVCNSITLNEYFYNAPEIKELYPPVRDSRGKSSRWFLNRYDFNDVLRLHIIKHTNILFLAFAIFILFILWSCSSVESLANLLTFFINTFNHLSSICFILVLLALTAFFTIKMDNLNNYNFEVNYLRYVEKKLACSVPTIAASFIIILTIIANIELSQGLNLFLRLACFILFLTFFILLIWDLWFRHNIWIHPIKNGHLFLPKLTASIMAAWLTLSRGIDRIFPLFENYFFVIVLFVIVFGFIMYQVNKTCPKSSNGAKICKSLEFMVISYCISLIVGLVVINYMGRNALEQNKYLNANYMSYVESHKSDIIIYEYEKECDNLDIDTTWVKLLFYKPVMNDEEPKYKKTIIRIPLVGSRKGILIMPRFWLMSSILAMFVGVFLQMLFFQEKQMTDI